MSEESGPKARDCRAVIFDLDGVIVDSEALQYKAYSKVLARFGVRVSATEYAEHWIALGQGAEYAVKKYGLPVDPAGLRALKNPVYHEILRQDGMLMPGAAAVLARLSPHFALGIATNSNHQDVAFVLDYFGLRRFFAAVITREDYNLPKPNPDAYLMIAARLAATPGSCLVVEDSYRGVLAAHRAGAVAVAIPNTFTRGSDFGLAATVLRNLDELTVPLIHDLFSARPVA